MVHPADSPAKGVVRLAWLEVNIFAGTSVAAANGFVL